MTVTVMQTSWLSAEYYSRLVTDTDGAFIAPLPAFETLVISGPDSRKYLQGQATCDLELLTADNFLRGAHCDAKGKMWSIFHVCAEQDELLVTAFRDELHASTAQWKKFGVFSKVSFNSDPQQYAVLGLGGKGADLLAQQLGFTPPPTGQLARYQQSKLLKLANEHYLLLVPVAQVTAILQSDITLAAPSLWLRQHIQHGLCYLEQALISEFVPQMLNLQAVDAISFTKGCYIGQETVARMKYLGRNKRAAYILSGESAELPPAGTDIEIKMNDNWRRAGQVINAVNINNQLSVIAVLPNDTTPTDSLRLKTDSETPLTLQPLPYSLD
ncbi:tRNA-modifying protein YgfZ [Chromatiaceae bacterium AAb-1]|nr:tRNA-modifying protein YgfZ [Chromatiaceae bacterium AAb-1]